MLETSFDIYNHSINHLINTDPDSFRKIITTLKDEAKTDDLLAVLDNLCIEDSYLIASAKYEIADILYLTHNFEKALEAVDTVITLKPLDEHSLILRGNILAELDRYDEALTAYNKALEPPDEKYSKEDKAVLDANLAYIIYLGGKEEGFLELYESALNRFIEYGMKEYAAHLYSRKAWLVKKPPDFAESHEMHQKALVIFDELGIKAGSAREYFYMGTLYIMGNKPLKARESYNQALKLCEELNDRESIGHLYSQLATTFQNTSDYEKALEMNQKSLEIFESLGMKPEVSYVYSGLAHLYEHRALMFRDAHDKKIPMHIKDPETKQVIRIIQPEEMDPDADIKSAIDMFEKAIQINIEVDDRSSLERNYGFLSEIYKNNGEYDKAVEYQQKALEITFPEHPSYQANNYQDMRDIYLKSNDLDKAIEMQLKAHEIFETVDDTRHLAFSHSKLGEIYKLKGDFEESNTHFQKANELFKKSGDLDLASKSIDSIDQTTLFNSNVPPVNLDLMKSSKLAPDNGKEKNTASPLLIDVQRQVDKYYKIKYKIIRSERYIPDRIQPLDTQSETQVESVKKAISSDSGKFGKALDNFELTHDPDTILAFFDKFAVNNKPSSLPLKQESMELAFHCNDLETAHKIVDSILMNDPENIPALNIKGHIKLLQKDFPAAQYCYRTLLDATEKKKEFNAQAVAYLNLGLAYSAKFKRDIAFVLFEKSRIVFEKLDDQFSLARVYTEIGKQRLKARLEDKDAGSRAIEAYDEALEISQTFHEDEFTAHIYNGLGNAYLIKDDPDKAMQMFKNAFEIFYAQDIKEGMADTYSYLGDGWNKKGIISYTIENYEKALEINESLDRKLSMAGILFKLAVIHSSASRAIQEWTKTQEPQQYKASVEQSNKAIEYYERAVKLNIELNREEENFWIYNNLANQYEKIGEIDKAIESVEKRKALDEKFNRRINPEQYDQWFARLKKKLKKN